MKRTLITLGLSAGLLVALASTAAGAQVTRLQMLNDVLFPDTTGTPALVTGVDSDLHLRLIDEVLYPQPSTWLDFICDGVAPCAALPGSEVVSDTTAKTPAVYETLDPEEPVMFDHVYVPAVRTTTEHDWPWCAEVLCRLY